MKCGGLIVNDSHNIAFVLSSLMYEAISIGDLKIWCDSIIKLCTDVPLYIFDLAISKEETPGKILGLVGFTPEWPFCENDKLALYGIAFKRGIVPYDCPISKESAIEKLNKSPKVENKFRETFPFIVF